jgi:hypothetical protein
VDLSLVSAKPIGGHGVGCASGGFCTVVFRKVDRSRGVIGLLMQQRHDYNFAAIRGDHYRPAQLLHSIKGKLKKDSNVCYALFLALITDGVL